MKNDIFNVEVVEYNKELLSNQVIDIAIGIGSHTLYKEGSTFNVLFLEMANFTIVKEYIFKTDSYLNFNMLDKLWHEKMKLKMIEEMNTSGSIYLFNTTELQKLIYENSMDLTE